MLGRFAKSKSSDLDEPIKRILADMEAYGPDNEAYTMLVEHLERLKRMKMEETHRRRPSPDTVLVVVGNILGILAIVAYEQKHVMASRGLGFVMRPREPSITTG